LALPRVYLIRHGETEWSRSGQHTGRTDIPLTAHGEVTARELMPRLQDITFSTVMTSPLQRARRTCELAGLGCAAELEPDLAEWDYGDYEGLTTADIQRHVSGWSVFQDGCPGGEAPGQIGARADRLIGRLRKLGGDIALFSHGQFGCVLAARWIGLAASEAEHFVLDPASISIFGPRPGHPAVPVIARWNTVSATTPCPSIPDHQFK
jgi:probable phosphoglycerate mutase